MNANYLQWKAIFTENRFSFAEDRRLTPELWPGQTHKSIHSTYVFAVLCASVWVAEDRSLGGKEGMLVVNWMWWLLIKLSSSIDNCHLRTSIESIESIDCESLFGGLRVNDRFKSRKTIILKIWSFGCRKQWNVLEWDLSSSHKFSFFDWLSVTITRMRRHGLLNNHY